MSDTTMYLFSFASIVHDSIIALINKVGKLVSSLLMYCGKLCFNNNNKGAQAGHK